MKELLITFEYDLSKATKNAAFISLVTLFSTNVFYYNSYFVFKYQYSLSPFGDERSNGWQVNSRSDTVLGGQTCALQFAEAEFGT
jgi:hypothetical protein